MSPTETSPARWSTISTTARRAWASRRSEDVTMKKLLALALLLAGCGASTGGTSAPDAGAAPDAGLTSFIALDPDFQSYKDWQMFTVLDDGTGLGDRHIWLNHSPGHGAAEFPVGTVIVKEQKD